MTKTRSFLIIWFGQLISLVGSGLTSFAISVWVYQETGSATQLALVTLFFHTGIVLVSPVAGPLVDKWGRKRSMLIGDIGSAVGTLIIAIFFFSGNLQSWHIYLGVAINAAFRAIQWPAYSATIAVLIPTEQLGRANGLVQLGRAIGEISAPVLAGALIAVIQLEGIIIADFATFLFALTTLILIKIPEPAPEVKEEDEAEGSLWQQSVQGWRYIRQHPGLVALLGYMTFLGFNYGIALVLFIPLVLGFASEQGLGTILSIGSFGMLVGGAAISIWGGPKNRVLGMLGMGIVMGIGLLFVGLRPDPIMVTIALFITLSTVPIIGGLDEALWQSKIPAAIQGRVFATRNAVTTAVLPFASLSAGPLAEFVFEPLFQEGGGLSSTLGLVFGTGSGRGVGFIFVQLGILTIVIAIAGFSYSRLRLLEAELPDQEVAEEMPTEAPESPGLTEGIVY